MFVSAGLGGMSGAQPKAAVLTGAVAVIAEVNGGFLMPLLMRVLTLFVRRNSFRQEIVTGLGYGKDSLTR